MADNGRVAWITGGSAGIGLAVARTLAEAGYTVVISARDPDLLAGSCVQLQREGARADHVAMDVAMRGQVDQACRTVLDRHGRIDVLVNNAGYNVKARRWADLDPDEFDAVFAANLNGTFYTIHAVLPAMRANGGGVIVNISSIAGKRVSVEGGVAYTAAKQAVFSLTESLNMAEWSNGIRACVVAPGGVGTRAHAAQPQEIRDPMLRPEDVARAVRFAVETPPHAAIYEVVISPTHRWG